MVSLVAIKLWSCNICSLHYFFEQVMRKSFIFLSSILFSPFIFSSQFIVVECRADPGGYAYVSEPETGKMLKTQSCGEALAHIPANYFFISSVGAGGKWGDGVKYLFSDKPVNG